MHDQEQQFDVFISYARADNRNGGINRLIAAIEEDHARFFPGSRLRVFFDTQAIENGEDWSNRLYTGLKRSRMMIAMLSANYLASPWCRREWQAWCEVERSRGWLSNMLCPVYYVEVPDSVRRIDDFVRQRDELARNLAACSLEGFAGREEIMEEDECLAELFSRQTVDLKAWYAEGEEALRHEEIRNRIEGLARTIEQKAALARSAEQDAGNFIRANRNFCGRIHELKHIRHCFARPERGVVPVLHGVGGEGKTALAIAYAHAFAYDYPGGRFLVQCEGMRDLKQCFCKLGEEQGLLLSGTGAAAQKRVWEWLQHRPRGRCLVILDTIDDPALLSQTSLVEAVMPTDLVHVLVTTRCDRRAMGAAAMPVSLGNLFLLDALRLLGRFRAYDESEKDAARNIIQQLGGHALSLQLAGAFLHENPDVSYADFAEGLQSMGMLDVLEQAREAVSGHIDYANIRRMQVEQLVLPTLESCSDTELRALELASLLAPEGVVGPWIQAALSRLFPESMQKKGLRDPWAAIARKFTGLCLWQEQEAEGIFRIHRLVREVLRVRLASAGGDTGAMIRLLHGLAQEAATGYLDGKPSWPLRHFLALPPTLENWLAQPDTQTEILVGLPEMLIGKILRGAGREAQCASLAALALVRISALAPENTPLTAAYLLCRGQTFLARGLATEAIADYDAALTLLTDSVGDNTPALALQRVRCLDYAGEAELAHGRPAEALQRHKQALAILDAAPADSAGQDLQWHMERCYTLDHLAAASTALESESGRSEALALHVQALETRQSLCRKEGANQRLQRDLAISCDFVGNRLVVVGQHEEAADYFQQALRLREELCKNDPDSTVLQRDCTISHNKVGDGLAARGERELALENFTKALSIRKTMVEREPENALFLYDYSLSQIKVGEIHLAMGQCGEALGCFRLTLSIRKKLSALYPGNMKFIYGTALALEKCATAHEGLKEEAGARLAYGESARLVRELFEETPENSPNRPGLEKALAELEALALGAVSQGKMP